MSSQYSSAPPPPPVMMPSPMAGPAGPSGEAIPPDARTWAMLCHLGALASGVVPFGTIIGPLVFWMMKRDEYEFVNDQGREAVNFQISIFIYSLFTCGLAAIFGLVMLIIAAVKANAGERYRYPLCIRFIKG